MVTLGHPRGGADSSIRQRRREGDVADCCQWVPGTRRARRVRAVHAPRVQVTDRPGPAWPRATRRTRRDRGSPSSSWPSRGMCATGGLAWEGIANRVRASRGTGMQIEYLVGKLGRGVRACPTTVLTAIFDTRRSEHFLFPKAIKKFFHKQRILRLILTQSLTWLCLCANIMKIIVGFLLSLSVGSVGFFPDSLLHVRPLAGSVCFCRA